MEKHPTHINIDISPARLATEISNLRYDALAEFIGLLQQKILAQSQEDQKRGRQKLAAELLNVSNHLAFAESYTEKAWEISKPYMEEE